MLLAWLALALWNAIQIANGPLPPAGVSVRFWHHVYDAGHLLLLGLGCAAAVTLWVRVVPNRPLLATLAIAVASIAFGVPVVGPDLRNLAERAGGAGADLWWGALTTLVSLVVPVAWFCARAFLRSQQRGRLPWLPGWFRPAIVGAVALGIAALNAFILNDDYAGVHFELSSIAAVLGALALGELPIRLPRMTEYALTACCAVLSVATVTFWPSAHILSLLLGLDTAVATPWLASLRHHQRGVAVDVQSLGPWFQSRAHAREIPPTSPRVIPEDPVVILITVDALRADVLERTDTLEALPAFRELRDHSTYFPKAWSLAPNTRPTLASVFSGKYFSQLDWTDPTGGRPKLDRDRHVRFPELLRKRGVATFTVVSEHRALKQTTGIVRGFAEEILLDPPPGQDFALAPAMMDRIIQRVEDHQGGPLFVFAHLLDPHFPYDTGGGKGSAWTRYIAEVGVVERELDRLQRALDAPELAARSVLIVGADHGEGLGDHGIPKHSKNLFDVLIRVPLMLRIPGVPPRRMDEISSLLDLGPTILDLFGVSTPGDFMGQSLLPLIAGQAPRLTRPLAAETWFSRAMLFPDGKKVTTDLRYDTQELYDLGKDPGELDNRCGFEPDDCARRLAIMNKFFEVHARPKRK